MSTKTRMELRLTFQDNDVCIVGTGMNRQELLSRLNVYDDFPWLEFGDSIFRVDSIKQIDILDEVVAETDPEVQVSLLSMEEARFVMADILDEINKAEYVDPTKSFLDRIMEKLNTMGFCIAKATHTGHTRSL